MKLSAAGLLLALGLSSFSVEGAISPKNARRLNAAPASDFVDNDDHSAPPDHTADLGETFDPSAQPDGFEQTEQAILDEIENVAIEGEEDESLEDSLSESEDDSEDDSSSEEISRQLAATTDFYSPLSCNAASVYFDDCTDMIPSTFDPASGSTLEVPCGECYIFNLGENGEVTIPGGIDVKGHLKFPDNYNATIYTPFITVQGKLSLSNDKPVSPDSEQLKIVLDGTVAGHRFTPESGAEELDAGTSPFLVTGGQLDISGLPTNCRTWAKITGVDNDGTGILVADDNGSISSCWGAGAMLHITSSTFDSNDGIDVPIKSIAPTGNNQADITLEGVFPSLVGIITESESPEFAVEVMLKDRNVKVSGGGYLQVYHTPDVAQHIDGMEFKEMGQAGTNHRFPIEFLYSGSVNGTIVSRNSIVDSNQRCISIEGTADMIVTSNTAHNSKGNCIFLGHQAERNFIHNNIVAHTIKQQFHYTYAYDDWGPSYGIHYPDNDFVDNVAAGGNGNGFWAHMIWYTMNEDYGNSGLGNIRRKHAGLFTGNVAHSYEGNGLDFRSYEQGQNANKEGHLVIEGSKSYRNKNKGLYTQYGDTHHIINTILADNRMGYEAVYTDDLYFENVDIRGLTPVTHSATENAAWKLCQPSGWQYVIGLQTPSRLHRPHIGKNGLTQVGTKFSGFDLAAAQGCEHVEVQRNNHFSHRHFDYTSIGSQMTLDPSGKLINLCYAKDHRLDDVVMFDADGSMNPAGPNLNGYSSFVTDVEKMTAFNNCTSYPDQCLAYCPDQCLRTLTFTSQHASSDIMLKVTREDGQSFNTSGIIESENHAYEWTHRKFGLTLPPNYNYTAKFVNPDGSTAWPVWALGEWDNTPQCDHVESDNIVLDINMTDADLQEVCTNVVPNGDMENGVAHWVRNGGNIESVDGGADGSAKALLLKDRSSPWHFIGTNLDTSCHKQTDVKYYEIQAFVRVVDGNGAGVHCEPFVSVWDNRCPKFTLKYQGFNSESFGSYWTAYDGNMGEFLYPIDKDDWNEIHKVFKVSGTNKEEAERMFLYLEYAHRDLNVLIDNVSVRPFTPPSESICKELVQNGKIEKNSKFWDRWGGNTKLEVVEGVDGVGDFALKAYNRLGWYSDSPSQELFMDCVKGGDRIVLKAKYKYEKDDQHYGCNMWSWDAHDRCGDIFMYNRKSGTSQYHRAAETVIVSDKYHETAGISPEWNIIEDVYTFPEGRDKPEQAKIYFEAPYGGNKVDITVDDVSAEVIPQDCSSLILNGGFDDGTASFWRVWDRKHSKLQLVEHDGGYALANYDRTNRDQGMRQSLDARCFTEGAVFEIKGKFKLLEGMAEGNMGTGANCDTGRRRDDGSCPKVRVRGWDCSYYDTDTNQVRYDYWLSFWNDLDFVEWDPNNFNDFHATFYVDERIASCANYEVIINRADEHLAVVMDDLSITAIDDKTSPEPNNDITLDEADLIVPPTSAPTTSLAPTLLSSTACPPAGSSSDIGPGAIMLEISDIDALCVLTKVDSATGKLSSFARSYEGNDWEMVGGDFPRNLLGDSTWQCYDNKCQITLPDPGATGVYRLYSYNHDLPQQDKVARLLESTTFGPTWDEVSAWTEFTDENVAEYISSQMNVEATSHREFFRKRLNPRFHASQYSATPDHPCSTMSRWRKFAFSVKDGHTHWSTEHVRFGKTPNGEYIVYARKTRGSDVGEYHVRTVVPDFEFETGDTTNPAENQDYNFCSWMEEKVDGVFHLDLNGCRRARNPRVDFTGYDTTSLRVIELGDPAEFLPIDEARTNGDELYYTGQGLSGAVCDSLTHHIDEIKDEPIFGRFDDGTWVQFDPRLELRDNTLDAPIMDGGASLRAETDGVTNCANVPRSPFNEETCALVEDTNNDCVGTSGFVCGSAGEVSNDPSLGNHFDIATSMETFWGFHLQREQTWVMIALQSHDQLRQRVAWALSQIIVMVKNAISASPRQSESFLLYYDIFVKNAFGNYKNILKEISFNSLMGENLSYRGSRSAAYMRKHHGQLEAFPDENFAREFMQLFTIGVSQLNSDGSAKLDDNGEPIPSYSNDEIMSFARAWTGFERHYNKRGNVEDNWGWGNHIDPMKIDASWRDTSPKSDVLGGYIGDGYALCADLPSQAFLKKGATYRFLGRSKLSDFGGKDHNNFEGDGVVTLNLDAESILRELLCNGNPGACDFVNSITLESSLGCIGVECRVDTIRVVEVEGHYYEYIRPPCVEQAFYNNAKKLNQRHRPWSAVCANPSLPVASGACCLPNKHDSLEHYYYAELDGQEYDGERTTYATAEARCEAVNKVTCDFELINVDHTEHFKLGFHWTDEPCKIRAKIDELGNVATLHLPSDMEQTMELHVDEDNTNFFRAYWDGNSYPKASSNCNGCEVAGDGCVCDVDVRKARVFNDNRLPRSVAEVMSNLYIGAIDPETDTGTYSLGTQISTADISVYNVGSTIEADSIFSVTDGTGRTLFFKNTRETVHMQTTNGDDLDYSFRNAPRFMSVIPTETASRDAHFETDAVIDHFFYHPNTAPFISYRIIQRFALSNPSPRYVTTVAEAFRSGTYTFGGKMFGSGEYGCLNATIAATLLDREARSVVLEADPTFGGLKEPLMKVIGVMRSMEFVPADDRPVVQLQELATRIGEMAHGSPTVFNFYLPAYKPNGPVGDADLYSPESVLLDMPKTINILNGMFSLSRYGLNRCHGGLGPSVGWHPCNEIGNFEQSAGALTYEYTDATEYVERLATLLTAGRLSTQSREIIADCARAADYVMDGLLGPVHALTLLLTAPEFHSNNLAKKSGSVRESYTPPEASNNTYKAIVYIMLSGGCDSMSTLIPHTCNGTDALYQEHTGERTIDNYDGIIDRDNLLPIAAEGQVCETFGVHPSLSNIQTLYNDMDLIFFANTGVLTKPSTKENYWQNTKTALFGHDSMQREAKRVNPYDKTAQTGVLGRIADAMSADGYNFGSFSIDWHSEALVGEPGKSPATSTVSQRGTDSFNPDSPAENMLGAITSLNEAVTADSGVFAEQWSSEMLHSLVKNEKLHTALSQVQTSTTFPDNHLGRQLSMVSRLIATRETRVVDRDLFFVQMGGFDTHHMGDLSGLFSQLNEAVGAFVDELKVMKVWDSVTTVQTSDFGRTLVPNTNGGTDHGWGGNYFMFGGDVKGGQVKGRYPDNLTKDGPNTLDRGRFIPTTAWDSIFTGLSEWYGVDLEKIGDVCPNAHQFDVPGYGNFAASDLFGAPDGAGGRRLRKGKMTSY